MCDGDSPLIVDIEEVVANIPADILEQPPDSSPQASQVPATTVASTESVSERLGSMDGAPMLESPERAENSVVSVSKQPNIQILASPFTNQPGGGP